MLNKETMKIKIWHKLAHLEGLKDSSINIRYNTLIKDYFGFFKAVKIWKKNKKEKKNRQSEKI